MAQPRQLGKVRVLYSAGTAVRAAPVYPGQRTGVTVSCNDVVVVSEVKTYTYTYGDQLHHDLQFYKLENGDGWIHDYNPDTGWGPAHVPGIEWVQKMVTHIVDPYVYSSDVAKLSMQLSQSFDVSAAFDEIDSSKKLSFEQFMQMLSNLQMMTMFQTETGWCHKQLQEAAVWIFAAANTSEVTLHLRLLHKLGMTICMRQNLKLSHTELSELFTRKAWLNKSAPSTGAAR